MFNSENKTHYKMYKAGKRWLFGAITVTTFTAGIVGGTLLSNGKSVHADTTVSTTQSQNTNNTNSDNAADKAQDSNVQANDTKTAPVASQTSEDTKAAATSNNDQKAATTQADATNDQNKNAVTTPAQDNNVSQAKPSTDNAAAPTADQNKTDQAKQQADTTSAAPQNADDSNVAKADSSNQNDDAKATDQKATTQADTANDQAKSDNNNQKTDAASVANNTADAAKANNKSADQNQAVAADKTANTDQKNDDQNQNTDENQAAPANDVQKATADVNQSQAQTNLAATDGDALKVTFTDPNYDQLGLPWVDQNAEHFTYGYDTVGTAVNGQTGPVGPSPVNVRYIIWSADRNGDGTVYYNEIDENGKLIDTITLNNNVTSVASQNISGLSYYLGAKGDKYTGFRFDSSAANDKNIRFQRNWAYDTPAGVPNVQYGAEGNFIPQVVQQKVTWVNKDTRAVMAEHTYTGIAGQQYSVTGMPPEIPNNYYTSLVPANASGTVSNFGVPGTVWTSYRSNGYSTVYTETDDHGGMDVQLKDANGNVLAGTDGQTTYHIDANYQYDPTTQQYSWTLPNNEGLVTLLPIYVPQSRNIVFEVAPLGKLVPVDKDGNPIDNGSHNEPYNIDPNDPTKAQQPTIPDIPGYVPVDPNDPSKVLTPGDPSPVPVNPTNTDPDANPGKDTKIPYVVDKQTATVTYVDQDGNKVLHTDDVSGKIGEHKDYSTDTELADLAKDGYTEVSSDVPANGITLDYNSGKPLAYTVVVKKAAKTEVQTGTGSLTIHYQYSDGTPVTEAANGSAVTDVKGDAKFHRTVEVDPDTGKVLNPDTPWVADDGQNLNVSANSPVVTGYYTDQATASGTVVEGKDATIVVVYNKLGNLIPEVPGGTPVPYPNDPTDPTKPGQPITPDYPGYTPLDPNGNPIKPGTPYPINPNEPGKDTPVPYVADPEQAHVQYVDQDDNDAVLHSDDLNGKFGEKADYSTAKEIAYYLSNGYDLVSDGYPKDGYTYTTADPTFTIVLKHKHKTVNPDNPGTPGQPVDPNNPDGPKYPDGTSEQDVLKNITRTIHYQYADGTEASKDVTEQVKYTRSVTFDEVTGKIISSTPWTSTNPDYAEVTSPVIPGYVADQAVVGEAATKATDSNSEVTVHYNPAAEKATVTYVDDVTGKTIPGSPVTDLNGNYGENINKSDVEAENAKLEAAGYVYVNDNIPAQFSDQNDQGYTVHFTHGTEAVADTGSITVHYEIGNVDGPDAAPDQTVTIPFTGTRDKVTGEVTDWKPADNANPDVTINSPKVTGYTPTQVFLPNNDTTNPDSTDGSKVTWNVEPGMDCDADVVYTADPEQAHVQYVDQDNNNAVLHSDNLDGKFDEKSGYTTKDEIAALEKQGYELVTDGYPADGYTFTTENPTFTVVLKHKTKTVTPDTPGTPGQPVDPNNPDGPKYPDGTSEQDVLKDITRTIHYQYADGTEASKDVTEQVKYTRSVTFDEVTGKIISATDWSSQNPDYAEVTSPVIPGFVADQPVVGKAATKETDGNTEVTVHYNPAVEQAHVQYVDQDNNNAVLHSDNLDGKFGEKSGYTTKDEIAALEKQGYELVTDGYPADYTFTTEDPTFTVVLKHKTKTVTPDTPGTPGQPVDPNNPDGPKYPDGTNKNDLTKDVTRTIHYKDDKGNTVSADVDQSTSFGREATFDEVTGKIISYGNWNPANDTFGAVNSPVINGYYTDTAKVDAETVSAESDNSEVTVIYHPLGKLIPEVPGGTPVPYPNDPTDPTKPTDPITPNYPGYTPLDPNGNPIVPGTPYPINPNEPGKDTPVPYVADAEKARVNYVDQDNNDSIIKSDNLDGKFGEKSGYTTKDEIATLENEGYELVTDGYPADGYTFNTDDPTFTVVLKHKTKTVTPDTPGTPGQPIDPNNPDGPKYPDGTGETDLVKNVTRTIHYKDDQGHTVSQDVVETTKFTHDITFDQVTGQIIDNGKWVAVNDTYGAVNSPVINGYYTETPVVGAETVNADATNSEVTVLYKPLGHLVPDVPGSTPVIYPNNPTNPSEAGNPIIPDIPGYTPVDGNGNKLTPGTPYPINSNEPGKDTPIHYVKNVEPAAPVTPSTPAAPAQPAEPSAPVTPAAPEQQPATPAQPAAPAQEVQPAESAAATPAPQQAPAKAETPAAPAAKPAEAPKKAALPQTGQDATTSLMSIIGAILLSILGFFGLDGFRKRNEDK